MTTKTILMIAFIILIISALNVVRKISAARRIEVSITFQELEDTLLRKMNPSLAHFGTEIVKAIQGSNVNYAGLSNSTIDRIRSYDYADVVNQSSYKRIYEVNREEIELLLKELKHEVGMDVDELTSMSNWQPEAQRTEIVLLNEIAGAIDELEFAQKKKMKGEGRY